MNRQIKTSNHELGTDTQNWVIQNFGKLVVNVLALGVGFYIFKNYFITSPPVSPGQYLRTYVLI